MSVKMGANPNETERCFTFLKRRKIFRKNKNSLTPSPAIRILKSGGRGPKVCGHVSRK